MATRKPTRPKYPPKAVEFHFDEKMPRRPALRRSRLVRGATAAANRLVVEELLCRHHGASDAALRRLSPAARKVLFRIVTDPADRDHIYRRDAVSALAAIGSRDAVMLLSALATDENEDAVIVGRALNALAKLGGDVAAHIIERSMEHRDAYVRTVALKAMMKLEHPASVPALTRAAETHPSPILQARARKRLAELGAAVKGSRSLVTRNTGVLVRESER
jgi:HEAT repeat protein